MSSEYETKSFSEGEVSDEGDYDEEEIEEEIVEDEDSDSEDVCKHKNQVEESEGMMCLDCGMKLEHELCQEKEWRYYGSQDSRHSSNPSRCHLRKSDEKTIYNDVSNMGFPPKVVELANSMYQKITINKIKRGSSRKAIIFACIYQAYKEIGQHQSPERIAAPFGLKKKTISHGMKIFSRSMRKSKKLSYTEPIDLVPNILKDLNAGPEHTKKVEDIYEKVKDRSSLLNRSNPQSTAAGLVYYYCRSVGKKIVRKDFSDIVGLSEITIVKISKEIAKILGTDSSIRL